LTTDSESDRSIPRVPITPMEEYASAGGDRTALLARLNNIVEFSVHADQLAQALIERVDALHERAAVVQHASLESLLGELKSLESRLSEGLDHGLEQCHDTTEQLRTVCEHAKSEAASGVESLNAQVHYLRETVTTEVQNTSSFMTNRVGSQVAQSTHQSLAKLEELLSKAHASWSHAHDDVQRTVDDVLGKTGHSLSDVQSGAMRSAEDSMKRIAILKSGIDDCAHALHELIGTFSDLMSGTRVGLNVTAGTLDDLVSIFEDIA
jgi:ABC-type transporter Mla subunit MlaD